MKPPKFPRDQSRKTSANSAPHEEPVDAATLAQLSDAVMPVAPPADMTARMRERILEAAQNSIANVVRAGEGEWKNLLPGIRIKTLHFDGESGVQTSLWRLNAGARVPPHPHSKSEECLILEGSIEHDGHTYHQGDYLFAQPGERHKDFISPNGALLMIRGERIPNRLLLNLAMLLPH